MNLQEISKRNTDIFFDEWKNTWVTIELIRPFQNYEIKIIKVNREYYVYEGIVISENNPFRMKLGKKCNFYFSRKLFDKEISRHILFDSLPNEGVVNLQLTMRRLNKHNIEIKDVELLKPN